MIYVAPKSLGESGQCQCQIAFSLFLTVFMDMSQCLLFSSFGLLLLRPSGNTNEHWLVKTLMLRHISDGWVTIVWVWLKPARGSFVSISLTCMSTLFLACYRIERVDFLTCCCVHWLAVIFCYVKLVYCSYYSPAQLWLWHNSVLTGWVGRWLIT